MEKLIGTEIKRAVPKGEPIPVHHKKPLQYGGDNSDDNLTLRDPKGNVMTEEYHQENNKPLHWYEHSNEPNPFGPEFD